MARLRPGGSLLGIKAELRLLLEALRSVPLAAQEILDLFFWEGLTGAQIAEILGVGEDTARTRLRRARLLASDVLKQLANSRTLLESTLSDLDSWARSVRPQDLQGATRLVRGPGRGEAACESGEG